MHGVHHSFNREFNVLFVFLFSFCEVKENYDFTDANLK